MQWRLTREQQARAPTMEERKDGEKMENAEDRKENAEEAKDTEDKAGGSWKEDTDDITLSNPADPVW